MSEQIVCRPRLHALLDQGLQTHLTLVSAPAGYGKSMLASHWVEGIDLPSAWLSLDADDGDLRTFMTYLLAAVRTVAPDLGTDTESIVTSSSPLANSVLGAYLLNELDELDEEFVVVLDDYHRIAPTSEVHDLLRFILEHPPPRVHIVLLTRSDPPLPLTSLRSGRGVAEIRMRDLRFTAEESSTYMMYTADLQVSESALANLQLQTEGWAVGLQFVAFQLRHVKDPDTFLDKLSGGVEQTQSYLLQEVLATETEAMRTCLLRASILDRFNADLLDAVCAADTSGGEAELPGRDLVASLHADNLFVIPLDAHGEWCRFHHLFQEMLQGHLKQQASAAEIADLHRRASSWFESEGLIDEAIRHALAAGEDEQAAEIVERHRRAEFTADRWYAVERWLAMLPTELKQERAELLLTEAWTAYYRIQVERISQLLEQVESRLQGQEDVPAVAAELAFFTGYGLYWRGDGAGAVSQLEKALSLCGHEESFCAAETEIHLGLARCMVGENQIAFRALEERVQGAVSREGLYLSHLHAALSFTRLVSGDLPRAGADACRMHHVATRGGVRNAEAWSSYLEGCSRLHAGKLEAAARHLALVADLRYILDPLASTDALAGLALSQQLLNRPGDAQAASYLLECFARETNDPYCMAVAESSGHRLAVLTGDLDKAAPWAQALVGTPSPAELCFWTEVPALTGIRVLIAVGSEACLEKAALLAAETRKVSEECRFVGQTVETAVLQSLVLDRQGQAEEALQALGDALHLAEPGGWMRPFVEAGPVMARMLQRRHERVGQEDFLQRLLAVLAGPGAAPPAATDGAKATADVHPLDELTHRERDVLELLARRLHNKEIADELCVSAHTVNFHLKQIYQKLDVHNRRQAVDRAVELGLLSLRAEG